MDHLIIENQIKIFPTGSKKQHRRGHKISSCLLATTLPFSNRETTVRKPEILEATLNIIKFAVIILHTSLLSGVCFFHFWHVEQTPHHGK